MAKPAFDQIVSICRPSWSPSPYMVNIFRNCLKKITIITNKIRNEGIKILSTKHQGRQPIRFVQIIIILG